MPLFDEIVLSTERMTEIESFDNVSGKKPRRKK